MNKKLSVSILILAISTYLAYGQQIQSEKENKQQVSKSLPSVIKANQE
ncbi:MAG: hypothetical protein KDD05_08305 [Psychroserpens sp.]|nr:hypothetical protein [Psychroserpens sp.]